MLEVHDIAAMGLEKAWIEQQLVLDIIKGIPYLQLFAVHQIKYYLTINSLHPLDLFNENATHIVAGFKYNKLAKLLVKGIQQLAEALIISGLE